jgi:hypothetical protein
LVATLALPGLVALAARGKVGSEVLQWWCCGQFFLLWGVVETAGPSRYGWLLVVTLLALWLFRLEGKVEQIRVGGSPGHEYSRLEGALTQALRAKAPPGLLPEIMSKIEPSVDFDKSLSAEAPRGFRERLLERLRKSEPEDS